MTFHLRAVLIVALVALLFGDFAWDNPWLMAGLT